LKRQRKSERLQDKTNGDDFHGAESFLEAGGSGVRIESKGTSISS
jgi:hypothetical protein